MIISKEIFEFSKEHETDDIHRLALQAARYPHIDMPAAIRQIKGLQIAKQKLPTFYNNDRIIYPSHLSLEQCSSEKTALYKSKIIGRGESMVDLTGGFGVDFYFLSRSFDTATYVEKQEELCNIVKHNLQTFGAQNSLVSNDDSVDYLDAMKSVDLIYIDPARRSNTGQKTVKIEDCTPNLLEIQTLLEDKSKKVLIKLSPMLDITLALSDLRQISQIHIISVNNECKELLFVKENDKPTNEPVYHCVNIKNEFAEYFKYTKKQESESISKFSNSVKAYLYEPNASIMKTGAYNIIGQRFKLEKLHPNTHLYTSDSLIKDFPGRTFKVISESTMNKKEIKDKLGNISEANIATRNFPLQPDQLKKRLKINDGGNYFIFGLTLYNNKHVLLLCERT